jgi:UDP-galactopyranose mutase
MRERMARSVAREFLQDTHNVVWLYHPTLLHVADGLHRKLLVYDVMDKFDAFEKSHETVIADEKLVLEMADVIFTGGQSLQTHIEQKLQAIGDARATPICYPSGIDLEHFSSAVSESTIVPEDIAAAPKPVFGYFGAVDERIDFELIAKLATAQPSASIVLIGPQLTRPAVALPRNVQLLGPRAYTQLPGYLKAFDVCLLPFRETALVAHISPTKTPEYLAGGKPVVSTAIPDVASTYGDVVTIASGDDFVNACIRAAQEGADVAHLQSAAQRARTWDAIAREMDAEIRQRWR